MAKFSYTEWEAAQARLTVFPTLDGTIREPAWWQQVTGKEPGQNIEDKKRHSSVISGEIEMGTLTLALSPERIDWVSSALDPDPLAVIAFAPVSDVFGQFTVLAESWLSSTNIPSLSRMAFGAILTHPEADYHVAYSRLPDYVPVQIDPSWRDFIFQINARRNLAVQNDYGLNYLNRLSRWSVQTTGRLVPGPQGLVSGADDKYAIRVEIDINTPLESREAISPSQLVALFHELMEAAKTIARDGVNHEQYRL